MHQQLKRVGSRFTGAVAFVTDKMYCLLTCYTFHLGLTFEASTVSIHIIHEQPLNGLSSLESPDHNPQGCMIQPSRQPV
jgi:hypothetical protein